VVNRYAVNKAFAHCINLEKGKNIQKSLFEHQKNGYNSKIDVELAVSTET
jgi:hypothetical protein